MLKVSQMYALSNPVSEFALVSILWAKTKFHAWGRNMGSPLSVVHSPFSFPRALILVKVRKGEPFMCPLGPNLCENWMKSQKTNQRCYFQVQPSLPMLEPVCFISCMWFGGERLVGGLDW